MKVIYELLYNLPEGMSMSFAQAARRVMAGSHSAGVKEKLEYIGECKGGMNFFQN